MIDCIFKLTLNKHIARWLNRLGLWMNSWMRCLAGGRCWEHERSRNLMEAQVFSFLHPFSLLSNSPSKAPRTKEISEDWRAAPSSACFNWGEEFGPNKTAHLLETEKRGTHSPMTANVEWETLAAFHPTHRHTAPIPPGMLRGSYRQRGLSNPAFPQNFHLLSLT